MDSPDNSLHDFSNTKVLVIGDIMIDQYWFGDVKRISPEAPVPVVDLQNTEIRLGGAANVALNILAMGAKASLIGIIGDDNFGLQSTALMNKEGIDCQYIVTSPERRTTVKSRVMAHGQNLLRIDQEDSHDMNASEWQLCRDNFQNYLKNEKPDIIILQDYNKGVLTEDSIVYFIKEANEAGIPVMVDPKKNNFWAYKHCTVFKPNLKEVREAMGENNMSLEDMHSFLAKNLENDSNFITLGPDGIFVGSKNNAVIFPTKKRNIVDVCGAGDTVLAIISLYWSKGADSGTIARLANIAGGQVCSLAGVVPVQRDIFLKEVEEMKII